MKIGIDIRPLQSSSRERGIGYYLRGLLPGLAAAGGAHEYVLLTVAGRPWPTEIAQGMNAEVVTLPLEPSAWRLIALVRYLRWLNPAHAHRRGMRYDLMLRRRWDMARLAATARRERLDVLHLPSVFEPEYFANVGPRFPCPVLQTVHDLIPEVFPEVNRAAGWPYWYTREMGQFSLAQGPGRIAAISESAREDAERLVPGTRGRVDVIFNGVGTHFAPVPAEAVAAIAAQYGLTPRRYFLTSGGTEWRKNLPTVLAAFAQFAPENPELRVVVPGRLSDEEQALIQQWAGDPGLDPARVIRPGFVPDAHLPALCSGAAALVFPSRYEGFGLPIVEAMRCGCPVLTARNSSLPEVGGDAALYVDNADDIAGLALLMQQILREPRLADALRGRGLDWSRRFTWEGAARQYLGLYAATVSREAATASQAPARGEPHVANRL